MVLVVTVVLGGEVGCGCGVGGWVPLMGGLRDSWAGGLGV